MAWPYRALIGPAWRIFVVTTVLLVVTHLAWRVTVPAWAEVPRLVLCLVLAVVVMYRWLVGEIGYAPVVGDELDGAELVHYSQLSAAELDPSTGAGGVDLASANCRYWSRMLRRDLFWPRRTVPAVYFFVGEPSAATRAGQVDALRSRVLVDAALVRGRVFQRVDGCVALPDGYHGTVSDMTART
ncbi:MAG: hypothetical protein WCF36_02695 [Candidatus Nanopelagicales bacterium]